MGEIIWGLSFWPFGYLVTGMTAVIIFFIFWSIIRRFIMKRLTKRYILANISLMIILIMGMLLTSPWNLID
jgi:asparagine N-glycosylation enzyme membrane subunit Stt3